MAARNAIEGKFGQTNIACGSDKIKAGQKSTSESWIAAIFFIIDLVQ